MTEQPDGFNNTGAQVGEGPLTAEYAADLVRELAEEPAETEWLEFKSNRKEPEEIGEYISALSNSAVLARRTFAYMLWGVEDETGRIVGTSFNPDTAKKGNMPLETWLQQNLDPPPYFQFINTTVDDAHVVVLRIEAARMRPVAFQHTPYIRVGSSKKTLADAPEKEEKLWKILNSEPFGVRNAAEHVAAEEVLQQLEHQAYFDLLCMPLPSRPEDILDYLAQDRLIRSCDAGGWNITELGAILLARRLDAFGALRHKGVRVLQYRGSGKSKVIKDKLFKVGYASGFEEMIGYITGLLPDEETIRTFRRTVPAYPEVALRELLANALIHQDIRDSGGQIMVELSEDRLEISNPGQMKLEDVRLLLNTPPHERNRELANFMHRCGLCEERGSGIRKVMESLEQAYLPAPRFESRDGFTSVTLFTRTRLSQMMPSRRIDACYWHACLQHLKGDAMTNSSLRERFGVGETGSAGISRLISATVEEGLIKPVDKNVGTRSLRYLPYWA